MGQYQYYFSFQPRNECFKRGVGVPQVDQFSTNNTLGGEGDGVGGGGGHLKLVV
jgi:hypothetical protein